MQDAKKKMKGIWFYTISLYSTAPSPIYSSTKQWAPLKELSLREIIMKHFSSLEIKYDFKLEYTSLFSQLVSDFYKQNKIEVFFLAADYVDFIKKWKFEYFFFQFQSNYQICKCKFRKCLRKRKIALFQ